MIINKLHIKDFQSHKDTTIEFTVGLNIIVGPSDVGKSSVLRAIQKIIRDVPPGKGFINDDADYFELTLYTDSGVIGRKVSASKNIYKLNAQEYGGFGREIPKEISDITNMPTVTLEDGTSVDLHFSFQHDRPFLISETASVRSKLLGNISGLNVLDKSIIEVNKDSREIGSNVKIIQKDLIDLKDDYLKITDPAAYEVQLRDSSVLLDKIKEAQKTCDSLSVLQRELSVISVAGKEARQKYDAIPDLDIDFSELRNKIKKYSELQSLWIRFTTSNNELSVLSQKSIPEVQCDFTEIKKKIESLSKIKNWYTTLEQSKLQETQLQSAIDQFDVDVKKTASEWKELLKSMKICPTCKREI